MSERVVKVPDVGEGVAEAELVEWHVNVGDTVEADQTIADVMTDKATVEIPSPVRGTIVWRGGELGDVLAVGSELVRIATGDGPAAPATDGDVAAATEEAATETTDERDDSAAAPPQAPVPPTPPAPAAPPAPSAPVSPPAPPQPTGGPHHDVTARPQAAPAVRLRAQEAGVDLRRVTGTGPAGRVTHGDLDEYLASPDVGGTSRPPRPTADDTVEDVKLIGLRKRIAQRMSEANTNIPHITYVDEVDLTLLQQLRESINADAGEGQPKLTILPFLVAAIVEAVRAYPNVNARFDDSDAGVLHVHRGVHVGIATQTDHGLIVPVVRHAEVLDLFETAAEIDRLATAARDGSATSAELSGSTITITSLGALGGLVTTPIINSPEVAIVGVNKLQTRPVWDGHGFVPRQMMNLSSSFDHRIVDGWDAAQFVQQIKRRLEAPAPLLMGPR